MSDEVPHQYGHHHESKVEEPIAPVKVEECEPAVESTDRGLFDFLSKKKEEEPSCEKEEEKFVAEFDEKVKVSEEPKYEAPKYEAPKYEEPIVEEKKHESLLEKLHRSDSSSSSSSDEEEVDEYGEKKKKKKGLKEKIKEKIEKKEEDTSVPIEKCDEVVVPEEKKGLIEKIKDKLPGGKKTEEVHAPIEHPHPAVVECAPPVEEKKGFLEKIKDKIPGLHSKTDEEKEKAKEHKEEASY